MKIVLVGPGLMTIPPVSWGAVELVIWDIKKTLVKLGHDVTIINTLDKEEIIEEINTIKPDLVHFHYDQEHMELLEFVQYPKVITSHSSYQHARLIDIPIIQDMHKIIETNTNIFVLSENIKQNYIDNSSIDPNKIFVVPNGVSNNKFNVSESPIKGDRSIFLGKIDQRKRQSILANYSNIDFIGPIGDYSIMLNNYLGEMTRKEVYKELSEYGNLVLLSEDEGHPLVCAEALSAGLGLVVTKNASDNLDINLPFITVVDENDLNDYDALIRMIEFNRFYSVNHREEIINYSKNFDWENIILKYYIPACESLI